MYGNKCKQHASEKAALGTEHS